MSFNHPPGFYIATAFVLKLKLAAMWLLVTTKMLASSSRILGVQYNNHIRLVCFTIHGTEQMLSETANILVK